MREEICNIGLKFGIMQKFKRRTKWALCQIRIIRIRLSRTSLGIVYPNALITWLSFGNFSILSLPTSNSLFLDGGLLW